MKNVIDHEEITGRDGYIIMQALAFASEMLRAFGPEHDEPSNRRDMDAILEAVGGVGGADNHRAIARAKLNGDPEYYVREGDVVRVKYPAHDWMASYEGTPANASSYTDQITAHGGEIVSVTDEAASGWTTIRFTAPSDRIEQLRETLTSAGAEIERG
jgi:hypothetical protein